LVSGLYTWHLRRENKLLVIQFLRYGFILLYRFTQLSLIRPYGLVELIFSLCQFMTIVVLEKVLNKSIILMVHLELEETNSFIKLSLMQMLYFCLVFAYVFPKQLGCEDLN
jgi:hypothetical protein